jgi:DNA-binding NtrC family response regulator
MSAKLLVVDQVPETRAALVEFLKRQGYAVSQASTCPQALHTFEQAIPDLCIVDCGPAGSETFELLGSLSKRDPKAPAIALTEHGTPERAAQAIRLGAEHFLTKPVDLNSLGVLVERVLVRLSDERCIISNRRIEERYRVEPFIGTSAAVTQLRELTAALAGSDVPVLLRGETGTGKGVLARWLHEHGRRSRDAFVDLNCAGLSRELAETELFGHARGSFTGASATKRGLLEIAHHGTLFLDEIGDLDMAVQPKLLKVLEEQTYRRVGEVLTRSADVRLISATHRNLADMTRTGGFRNDLLFRINTVTIELPSLRERKEDIAPLANVVIAQLSRQHGRPPVQLTDRARVALEQHDWPGNIRELRNVLERSLLLTPHAFLDADALFLPRPGRPTPQATEGALRLEDIERRHIASILERVEGRVEEAARLLDVPRSSLYAKLKRYRVRASSS